MLSQNRHVCGPMPRPVAGLPLNIQTATASLGSRFLPPEAGGLRLGPVAARPLCVRLLRRCVRSVLCRFDLIFYNIRAM